MFFILWGTKVRRTPIGYAIWTCPHCERNCPVTVSEARAAFHLYFIPFGYHPAGHVAECHWCDALVPADLDDFPALTLDWKPAEGPLVLAEKLGLRAESGSFTAPPTQRQWGMLRENLDLRRKRVSQESFGSFSLPGAAVATAALIPVSIVLMVFVGPEGKQLENMLLAIMAAVIMGAPCGALFWPLIAALLAHSKYAKDKLEKARAGGFAETYESSQVAAPPGSRPDHEEDRSGGGSPPATRPPPAAPAPDGTESFTVACPSCGKKLRVKGAAMGRTVRCPACAQPFKIGNA